MIRTTLRLVALTVALGTIVLWFFGGPNLGWTKTSVMSEEIDPVTELKRPVWENRFLPGVDFLAGGLIGSALILGGSFLFRKK